MELKVTETIQEVHDNLALSLELAKEQGKKVVGCLCSYSPTELILAAGAIPVGLCGSTQEPIARAEERLSADQCPKVKATYGRAISGTCPLFPLADCIIAETTCDGRKKMYELLEREVPMYVMDLPQKPDSDAALVHWTEEVRQARLFLERQLGKTISDDDLRHAIAMGDRRRSLLQKIYYTRKHCPGPINGLEFVNILSKLNYYTDFGQHIQTLETFLAELEELVRQQRYAHSARQPRILWTGLGNSLGCSKVLEIVEECGGVVVCQEGCGGLTRCEDLIGSGTDDDPLAAIARRYLRVTCSCMTPNSQRFQDLERLIEEFRIDGVIDLAWQFCQPFEIESYRVRELVKGKYNLPFLHVVTDYSQSDTEQLRIRIEAFMEQIAARKHHAH